MLKALMTMHKLWRDGKLSATNPNG